MKRTTLIPLVWLTLVTLVAVFSHALSLRASASPAATDAELRQRGVQGIHLLMDGNVEGSIEIFKTIQRDDPQSPLGYLLEANAVWWRIYYSTANLIDPDVFASATLPTTPYDAHFEDLLNTTIAKAESRRRSGQDVARNHLYAGMAYALRARMAGLRDKDLPTARAGKKMRSLLLKALQGDPGLIDAYLGVGIYNYYVDTLSAIVKILSFFIGLPGGSRAEGLEQLQRAAQQGELARAEAKFYLAKNYSRNNERQYARSMELFQELAREFPNNPLWPTLVGSLRFRLNEREQGEAIYREIFKDTAGKNFEVHKALHAQTRTALERLHPGERFAD